MTYYQGFLATRKHGGTRLKASVDPLTDLDLGHSIVSGMDALLAMARAIDDGWLPGRQFDWGGWIAPVRLDELDQILERLGWRTDVRAADLAAGRSYYLVGLET